MVENSDNRIFGLDLMRAMAICLVLIGHCGWLCRDQSTLIAQLLAFSSFLGVEIFFVLSGFLIGSILYKIFVNGDFNLASVERFLNRRWYRTLPNYYLILTVNIVIAAILGYDITELWRYFFFLQNFSSPMLPFFTESWSLSIEEFAYLLLPFTLFAGALIFRRSRNFVFIFLILLLILLFMLFRILKFYNMPEPTLDQRNLGIKSVVIYRIDSILIGVVFAWLSLNFAATWQKLRLASAFIGMAALLFFLTGVGYLRLTINNNPLFWHVFYLPLLSLTIALFLPGLSCWKSVSIKISHPVTYISLISYSLYLLHYGVVMQIMRQIIPSDSLSLTSALIFVFVYLITTFSLSAILYKFYEKPMTDKRKK